ncbi:MAG: hypothetical protein AB1512_13500 [Thermodesulfobacteriota bacterium]
MRDAVWLPLKAARASDPQELYSKALETYGSPVARLYVLSSPEKTILSSFITKRAYSLSLYWREDTDNLARAGILIHKGRDPFNSLLANYEIEKWAFDYLSKNPHLLEIKPVESQKAATTVQDIRIRGLA